MKRLLCAAASRPAASLILVALLGAGGGVAFSARMGSGLRYPDEREYLQLAENLAAGRGYSLDGRTPTAFRAPAYPFVLALVLKLNGGVPAMRAVNFGFYGGTLLLAGLIGRRLGGNLGGLFASVLLLAQAVFFYTAGTLYPQTLAAFLILVILWLYGGREAGGVWRFAVAGAASGILTLTVSTCAVVPAAVVVREIVRHRRRAWLPVTMFVVGGGLVMLPWQARNWSAFGRFVPISTNSGLNLLLGNSENTEPNAGVNVDISSYEKQAVGLDEIARDKFFKQAALRYVAEHPIRSGVMYLRKVLNYFNFRNRLWVAGESSPWRDLAVLLTYGGLLALGGARVAASRRHRLRREEALLLTLYLLHALVLAFFFTRIRFRVPFDSLLAIVGGAWAGSVIARRLDASPGSPPPPVS